MPQKTKSKIELARELIAAHPDAPSKTLARRLYKENKIAFASLESARSAVRRARGNCGKVHRNWTADKSQFRENGKSGWSPELPPSRSESWTPHKLPSPCTALVMSDAHIPYHNEKAVKAAVATGREKFNLTHIVLNGDWCDFYSVSRWDRDPKKRDLAGEIEAVKQSLAWLRREFPKQSIVFKVGNHEERWNKFIWNKAPEIWGLDKVQLPALLEMDSIGIEYVDEERPIMAGKLPLFHGHELPRGLTNPVNMARGAFLRMVDSVLCGHGHRTSAHAEFTWRHEPIVCWSTGCLCDMSPRYARINKWNHGFAVVEVDKRQTFNVHNFLIGSDGEVWST